MMMTEPIEVVDDYGTHSYIRSWQHDQNIHCPGCGLLWVWVDTGGGDYYVGPAHLCLMCGVRFELPGGVEEPQGVYVQVIKTLRSKVGIADVD